VKTAAATLLAIVCASAVPAAQDRWTGADKARHFGAGAAIASAGYGLSIPWTRDTKWRIVIGTASGVGAGAAKELRDRTHGTPSWRDFTWASAGAAAGVLVAWTVDKLSD
jgi:putative lipoprotein